MTILTSLNEILETGDPLIRTWPLVRSYWHPFLLTALYVFIVKRLAPAFMKNRKPFELRIPMIVYNFAIVSVYFYGLCVLIYNLLVQPDSFKNICSVTPVVKNHYSYQCTSAGWYIYILKYVEYTDTIFFILRKKYHLITNLHVIHHAALPLITWFLMRTETSGVQFIPGGINSFIHLIMYTYYGLAAMGPEVQKKLWWKEYLTILQMTQFVVIIVFMFVVVPLSGCKSSTFGVYVDIVFASLFLALFYNFYQKRYKKSSNDVAHSTSNGAIGVHLKERNDFLSNINPFKVADTHCR